MRTTTAATNWRWQRARSTGKEKVSTKAREAVERGTAFIGRRCRKCRFFGMNPRRMWKKISAKLNFAEKGAFFQTFTNCSHQTHNSAKILGYLIIKQRVLPNPMRFLPPNTHSKKGRREAALLVSFGTKENPFEYGKEESCERNPGGVPFALNPSFPSRRKGRKANRLPENFRQPAAAERRPFLCRLQESLSKGCRRCKIQPSNDSTGGFAE